MRILINTRDPQEHSDYLFSEAQEAIAILQDMGVQVLFTSGHHRKLAILDGHILWEGSLNILSQNDSCEIMRRCESAQLVEQIKHFIGQWHTSSIIIALDGNCRHLNVDTICPLALANVLARVLYIVRHSLEGRILQQGSIVARLS